ncbi:uncharacterized protein LOC132275380 [Cornus florida]|uniref:uncharacterized protein LOC132275380 n=1 Tax=Cornus florida TaxID=4283 RepID=UPI00289D85D2|nr:uncharacterized protein LOC132275380 [Cornus florida]
MAVRGGRGGISSSQPQGATWSFWCNQFSTPTWWRDNSNAVRGVMGGISNSQPQGATWSLGASNSQPQLGRGATQMLEVGGVRLCLSPNLVVVLLLTWQCGNCHAVSILLASPEECFLCSYLKHMWITYHF